MSMRYKHGVGIAAGALAVSADDNLMLPVHSYALLLAN